MKPAVYATIMTIETAIVVAVIVSLAPLIPRNWLGASIIIACSMILLFGAWVAFFQIGKDSQ